MTTNQYQRNETLYFEFRRAIREVLNKEIWEIKCSKILSNKIIYDVVDRYDELICQIHTDKQDFIFKIDNYDNTDIAVNALSHWEKALCDCNIYQVL